MTVYNVTVTALAMVFATLWLLARSRRDYWLTAAVARAGRIGHLMRQLDAAEVPLKARIAELTDVRDTTFEQLGTALMERNDARGEALMWKSFAQAFVSIEDAEAQVEAATAILITELAEVSA